MTEQDAPLAQREPGELAPLSLDQLAGAWLDAKFRKSQSERTRQAYADTLGDFRALLQSHGVDMDSEPNAIALAAQGWANRPGKGGNVPKAATFNHRLAVLSSFYTYGVKHGRFAVDPIQRIERAKVEAYAGAEALDPNDLQKKLRAIDRSSLEGLRDYTLLLFALRTGMRVAEIAALRWQSIHVNGSRVTVAFSRTKGGKTTRKTLKSRTSKALMEWLHRYYGPRLGDLAPDAPVWPALRSGNGYTEGAALSKWALQDIARRRLGVNFHKLRHTFAQEMERKGASVGDIQNRLGHSNLATTDIYLRRIRDNENEYEDDLFSDLD